MAHGLALALLLALGVDDRPSGQTDISATEKAPPKEWVMNDTAFTFPIQVRDAAAIRDITFQVSKDDGRTWQAVEKVGPESTRVRFFAPGDGLYCFRLLIVSTKGEVSFSSQQRVRVDTRRLPWK
jgi:hypothetical protein